MNLTQQQRDFLKTVRVHFCLPVYGGALTENFFIGMLKTCNDFNALGISFMLETIVNESLITRGRNSLVAKMLYAQGNSTHLMFIDSDVGFEPGHIVKLLLADKDVVGGVYPKKSLPIHYAVNYLPGAKVKDNLIEVSNLATGFMLIKRQVMETMIKKFPETHYQDNIGLDPKLAPFKYALFDTAIDEDTKEYLSEDWLFCKRWRSIGGKIYADVSIDLSHSGFYTFRGNQEDMARGLKGRV